MNAQAILCDVQQVYDALRVPPNIQAHCRHVAGVLAFLIEHWQGPALQADTLVAAGLLHDVGNIVKFDWQWPGQQQILGDEWARKDYWKQVYDEVRQRYGITHEAATDAMLVEQGVDSEITAIVHATGYQGLPQQATSGTWEAKLMVYADLRVAPNGVVSMQERLAEGRARYAQLHPDIARTEGFGELQEHAPYSAAAVQIERDIRAHLDCDADAITDASAAAALDRCERVARSQQDRLVPR